jgi:hypothetical protein
MINQSAASASGDDNPPRIRKEDVERFIDRFEDGLKSAAPGKRGIDLDLVQDIVREAGPDLVTLAVQGYVALGRSTKQRGYYQRASALAAVYQLQSGDDALAQLVMDEASKNGFQNVDPELLAPSPAPAPEPRGYHFQIDASTLASGDVYPIVRFLAFERATGSKVAELAALRGRCVLSFDLPDDGTYVWQNASARRVVRGLFDAMPYFPYFLSPRPELLHMQLFYLCVADPAAFKGGYVELSHDTVVDAAVATILSMKDVCEKTGETHESVVRETFAAWPTELVDYLLRTAREVREGPSS